MNHHSVSTKVSFHSGWVVIFLFVFCLLTLGCNASVAGTFNISPLKITLSKNSSIAVIQLKNVGDSATTIQLQTMRRMQDGEGDKLQLTREIIATPQIFSIKAGATQLIRVGMVGYYRLTYYSAPECAFHQRHHVLSKKVLITSLQLRWAKLSPIFQKKIKS